MPPAALAGTMPSIAIVLPLPNQLGKDLEELTRGSLILTCAQPNFQTSLYVFHHKELDTTCGFERVFCIPLDGLPDFRNNHPKQSDLVKWFSSTPNPEHAVDGLKEEILEPILALGDTLSAHLVEFKPLPEHAIFLEPSAGAIRNHLLGSCPFHCINGLLDSEKHREEYLHAAFPDFLDDDHSGEVADLIHEDFQEGSSQWVLCPGCIGYELAFQYKARRIPFERRDKEADPVEAMVNVAVTLQQIIQVMWQMSYGFLIHEVPDDWPLPGGWPFNPVAAVLRRQVREPAGALRFDELPTLELGMWKAAEERVLNDNCAICKFVPYAEGDMIMGLPCVSLRLCHSSSRKLTMLQKHFFHRDCLVPWLMSNNDCPVCRKHINAGGLPS